MKTLKIIALILLIAGSAFAKDKVAVYMTGKNQTSSQSEIMAFALTDAISESKIFTATERTKEFLGTIEKENIYQQSGMVDDSQIAKLGKKSGVKYVCVGELVNFSEVSGGMKENLLVARFIDVESATIIASAYKIEVLSGDEAMLSKSKELAKALISNFEKRDSNVKREYAAIYLAGGETGIGRILQPLLIDAVVKSKEYAASERTNVFLESLSKELGHQYSGEVDDEQLSKLGVQSGAKYVIALKVASSKIVNVRIIDVKSGDILDGKSKTATLNISDAMGIARSMGNLTREIFGYVSSFTDSRDKKVYPYVKIGEQVWMAKNLDYNANGSKCYDYKESNCAKYGRLYTKNTAEYVCPNGWHLPSVEEWNKLTNYVSKDNSCPKSGYRGSYECVGKYLKSNSGWNYYKIKSGNGTDSYNFEALPGGYFRYKDLSFNSAGEDGLWWSLEGVREEGNLTLDMSNSNDDTNWNSYCSDKNNLCSVRCVKD